MNDRYKVEKVYCDGRDMAIFMKDALSAINYDFSRYPTLTAVIEGFQGTWVYGAYDPKVPDVAREICAVHEVNLFSVNQMIDLFKQQEKLLKVVRETLNIKVGPIVQTNICLV